MAGQRMGDRRVISGAPPRFEMCVKLVHAIVKPCQIHLGHLKNSDTYIATSLTSPVGSRERFFICEERSIAQQWPVASLLLVVVLL